MKLYAGKHKRWWVDFRPPYSLSEVIVIVAVAVLLTIMVMDTILL